MLTLRAWEGLVALCVVALLLVACGISAPPAAAQPNPEQSFEEKSLEAVCPFVPRRDVLQRRLSDALESRFQVKTKLRRLGRLLPAFESYHGDLARAMRGVEAPAGVLRSIWQGQVQIAASLERDARKADERVRRGELFAAFDFVSTLDYASKFAAVLRREAGSPKSCPGDGQAPSG